MSSQRRASSSFFFRFDREAAGPFLGRQGHVSFKHVAALFNAETIHGHGEAEDMRIKVENRYEKEGKGKE